MKKYYTDPELKIKKFSFDELLNDPGYNMQNPSSPETDGDSGVDTEGDV